MDINIDISRTDVEVYKIRYVRTYLYKSIIGLLYGFMEIRVFHESAVHEEILVSPFLSSRLRFSDKSRNLTDSRLHAYRKQILTIAPSIDIGDALAQRASTQVHQFLSITMEREANLRIDQHDTLKGGQNIIQFRGIAFQELTTRWHIEEDVTDGKPASHGT